ncbi:hypothetical protein [Actinocorallia populi]|uniref:hypothetical protein n=1 Tax=Actinocorallia populi TaxID=2079200 RepID=UPI0013005EE6|nr:hypothetical protein [Actinocorallia populi]
MSDTSGWSDRQRGAVLASLLSDLLNTVPTARDSWTCDAAELDRRHRGAEELAAQMDRVLRPVPHVPPARGPLP